MNESSNAKRVCRELALGADPVFRISHIFAEREVSDALMALYAFFAAIDESCSGVSDEEVAVRKIAWWKAEAEALLRGQGTHPVSRELLRTGVVARLPIEWVEKLFSSAESRLEALPPATLDSLAEISIGAGMPRIQLEMAVCGLEPASANTLRAVAARRGIYALTRGSLHASDEKRAWWIPSSLLAHYGLTRSAYPLRENRDSARSISSEILEFNNIVIPFENTTYLDISDKKQNIRHFLSYESLLINKFKYMNKNSFILEKKSWDKARTREILACWRAARRVSLWK